MSGDAASTLHPIEKAILKSLSASSEPVSSDALADLTGLGIDQVRRGIEWLKFKNFISLDVSTSQVISASLSGQQALIEGLPERKLVNAIKSGKVTLQEIVLAQLLGKNEVNIAIANAKRNNWIQFTPLNGGGNRMSLTPLADSLSAEEKLLAKIRDTRVPAGELTEEEIQAFSLLKKRPDYVKETESKRTIASLTEAGRNIIPLLDQYEGRQQKQERKLTTDLIISGKWRDTILSPIDVESPAPPILAGRKHPVADFIDEVKEIFVGLGFSEIEGAMAQSSFWNFDALFTPQDHPAREMQDTFYISEEKLHTVAGDDQIEKVSKVHQDGWGYQWKIEEARRMVLRTHTTPVTLQYLAKNKPEDDRVFSVGRVFRNEKVSYKHLVEFFQVEGVFTGKNVNLRELMGLQREFYKRLGIKKIKFWPTFFPYTEPSLQSMVYNDRLEKWIELFGMGIFRPEVTRPLGIPNPVLAWGGGLERIAMLRFGLDDVRELYTNRVSWLRSIARCPL